MKIDNSLIDKIYQETIVTQKSVAEDTGPWNYYQGIIDLLETLQSLDIDLSNSNYSLKDYTMSIIEDLEENEKIDLVNNSWIMQWRYEERHDILVTLVLGDFEIFNEPEEGDLH